MSSASSSWWKIAWRQRQHRRRRRGESAPDGYSLLFATGSLAAFNKLMFKTFRTIRRAIWCRSRW